MKLGIVGLPNVGKSTLFNALTSTQNAQAANYPFCTIEPNSGIVPVPDARLDKLAEIWKTDKKTPAIVEFVDIAGLVKGASQGAGLGNKFLGHIRECDAIVHVVRCFDDDNIIHVVEDVNKPESVDPIRDIDAIDLELILADLEVVSNRLGRQQKAAKTGNKTAAAEAAWLAELAAHLEGGKPARSFAFDPDDDSQNTARKELGLLSAKPVIYAQQIIACLNQVIQAGGFNAHLVQERQLFFLAGTGDIFLGLGTDGDCLCVFLFGAGGNQRIVRVLVQPAQQVILAHVAGINHRLG